MALVIVIMVMVILLSLTGAGLLFSGLDLRTTAHHKTGTMTFYISEAGLSHAWRELDNGDGTNDFETVYGATGPTTLFANFGFGLGSYTVSAQAVVGSNPNRVNVTSTGCLPAGCPSGSSKAVVEAEFKKEWWKPKKAIITNGDLEINGNPNLMGIAGGAHSNQDMELSGNPGIQMADGLTASNKTINDGGGVTDGMEISGIPCIGSPDCTLPPGQQPAENKLSTNIKRNNYEATHNSAPEETIPKINPADYAPKVAALGLTGAGYILHNDGTVTTGPGMTCGADGLCMGGSSVAIPPGWTFSGNKWKVSGSSAADGVFYSEGKVEISGSPGSSSSPWQATIIARDDIKISSSPHIKPYPTTSEDLKNYLLVTGNDLEISGNMTADYAGGAILVHQQFEISGNPKINGFIIAGDGQPTWSGDPFPPSVSSSGVSYNEISGNPTITYNYDFGCPGPSCPPTVSMVTWIEKF